MQNWRGNALDNIGAFNTSSFVNQIWTKLALPIGLFCIVECAILFKGDDFSPQYFVLVKLNFLHTSHISSYHVSCAT
jgi:hypothetical protein